MATINPSAAKASCGMVSPSHPIRPISATSAGAQVASYMITLADLPSVLTGWLGPLVCALSYEGLSWFTGASVMLGGLPSAVTLAVILLYSLGAHGIMTLNDFKAIEGDLRFGGERNAGEKEVTT